MERCIDHTQQATQRARIASVVPTQRQRPKGRRPYDEDRSYRERILWVLRAGARGGIYREGAKAWPYAGHGSLGGNDSISGASCGVASPARWISRGSSA